MVLSETLDFYKLSGYISELRKSLKMLQKKWIFLFKTIFISKILIFISENLHLKITISQISFQKCHRGKVELFCVFSNLYAFCPDLLLPGLIFKLLLQRSEVAALWLRPPANPCFFLLLLGWTTIQISKVITASLFSNKKLERTPLFLCHSFPI